VGIFHRLPGDVAVEHLLLRLRQRGAARLTANEEAEMTAKLSELLCKNQPRLYRTYDRVRDALKQVGIRTDTLDGVITEGREAVFRNREKIEKALAIDHPSPTHWID